MKTAQSVPTPQPAMPGLDPERAERAARMLDRFAEMAMEQAEAMHQAVLAAAKAGDAGGAKEFSLAFDRVGRSLRRALALQVHLARKVREAADKAAEASARVELKERRRRQVARVVTSSITTDPNLDAGERLLAATETWGRLLEKDDIDAALALADHPIEEIILRLCRDIDVQPEFILMADPDAKAQAPAKDDSATDEHGLRFWPRTGRDYARYSRKQSIMGGPFYWFDNDTRTRHDRLPWEPEPKPEPDDADDA
ncbi:hypothetical protein [Inquilinus sp. CA228]|uniref:hypothetical protein n=1 Tax=Inquilinus sp. CA228 TaxID=3455609 RepID=UPI003F8D5053